jgi:hypothetical protein
MAHRTYLDSLGRRWEVWTVIPSRVERRVVQDDGAAPIGRDRRRQNEARVLLGEQWARGWLTFETRGEKRRLVPYPDEWVDLSEPELEALCRRATPVTPTRRLVE